MSNELLIKTKLAGAAINPYRFVKFGADDDHIVQAAAASDLIIGISDELGAGAAEQPCDYGMIGIGDLELGGQVTRGQRLTSDANGKGVAASAGDNVGAIAWMSGVSGDIIPVLKAPNTRITDDDILLAEVTISTAELLALNGTPKTLVAAPGAGKAVIPLDLQVFLDYNSAAYAGIAAGEDLAVCYTNLSGVQTHVIETTGFLDQTADQIRHAHPLAASGGFVPVANAAIVMGLLSGEITTGDSPLKVRLKYRIVDTAW